MLFVINFSWIALAFTSSVVGFIWLLIHRAKARPAAGALAERTAVVMPIYNEAPARVFAAMQAICEDVERTGLGSTFDYFFLSDTTDADVWIAEERAFVAMRERLPNARIYYRRRRKNIERKAGNIADFVTRWGGAYPHMVVLDADSLMSGETIVRLAAAMEGGSGRRHHPEPAADRQPQHVLRPPAAICRAHRRARHCRGTDRLDGTRRQLLGP